MEATILIGSAIAIPCVGVGACVRKSSAAYGEGEISVLEKVGYVALAAVIGAAAIKPTIAAGGFIAANCAFIAKGVLLTGAVVAAPLIGWGILSILANTAPLGEDSPILKKIGYVALGALVGAGVITGVGLPAFVWITGHMASSYYFVGSIGIGSIAGAFATLNNIG